MCAVRGGWALVLQVEPAVDELLYWCSFITPDPEHDRLKKGGFDARFYVWCAHEGSPVSRLPILVDLCTAASPRLFLRCYVDALHPTTTTHTLTHTHTGCALSGPLLCSRPIVDQRTSWDR